MNNPFTLQNDLNAFRGAVANEVNFYDHKVSVLQSNQMAKRTKALQRAKEFVGKGEELVKQGLEGAAVPHLSKMVYKGGKLVYNRIKGRASGEANNEGGNIENNDSVESSNDVDSGSTQPDATGETQATSGGDIEMQDLGRNYDATGEGGTELQDMVEVGGRQGATTGIESAEADAYANEGLRGTRSTNVSQIDDQRRMRMEDVDAPEEPGQVRPRARANNADDLGEDLADDAADVEQSGGSLAEGAGDIAQGAGDALSAGAEGVSEAISGGAEAAEGAATAGIEGAASGLAEAAAATSWIPFVGEILGAAAAATGLAAAGYGVYEEIAGGAKEAAAEKIPGQLTKQQLPSANLAGGYIAPVRSSVAV